ncbi:hypothetical protein THIOM_000013 [Candidatus Thiomargarita nelsonii]|uniref:Uncharacterized protein n=1 Tax=Candidatus Thiomargarita nelsonii TaxID=1003181 RepID=A0A176S7N3_9GAMM|nr:hypothetical protein THIOM_000013 [Candidatus Thiomargarita nelsonii]
MGDLLFDVVAWHFISISQIQFWRRQGLTVNFAIGCQRQFVQHDEMTGNHVIGQAGF